MLVRMGLIGAVAFGAHLLALLALRTLFLATFRERWRRSRRKEIGRAFLLGARFDARLAGWMTLPAVPLALLSPNGWPASAMLALLLAFEAAVLLLYCVDFGVYSYLGHRVNAVHLELVEEDPSTALGMIRESYPVLVLLAGLVLVIGIAGAGWHALSECLFRLELTMAPPGASTLAALSLALVLGFAIYGTFGRFPLRWSHAYFTSDPVPCQLALNPVLLVVDSWGDRRREPDPTDELRELYPLLASHLGVDDPDPDTVSLLRERQPQPKIAGRPNIVVVLLETFASFKVDSPLRPAPRFQRLAENGWLFSRCFVPMENTSRSLFAALFGIPDVGARRSTSRNPLAVRQPTILEAFEGYDSMYFIGGSASWGNLRGILTHNIEGIELFERSDFRSPTHDTWGISDLHLFEEAHRVLGRPREQPFFACIQTAGNHRPFRLPRDRRGFEPWGLTPSEVRDSGFFAPAELDGFRFLDHCVGFFLELARGASYFGNTLFVLLGDHGTTAGATDRRFGGLDLASFAVPLLFFSPTLLGAPRRIERVTSELDLLPTLASLLGLRYRNRTLGRDALGPPPGAAFTTTAFERPRRLGWIEEGLYATVEPDGAYELYPLAPGHAGSTSLRQRHPERASRMASLARAYDASARWLIHSSLPAALR